MEALNQTQIEAQRTKLKSATENAIKSLDLDSVEKYMQEKNWTWSYIHDTIPSKDHMKWTIRKLVQAATSKRLYETNYETTTSTGGFVIKINCVNGDYFVRISFEMVVSLG